MAYEDLKWEILEIKKLLHSVNSENHLLKVKVRKLQNEICKKDKQIISLLDPKKSSNIAKIVSERGASMVLNLTDRNNELEKLITLKDTQIKKLEAEKQTSKIYSTKDKVSISKNASSYRSPYRTNAYKDTKSRSRSLSVTPEQKNKEPLKSNSEIQLKLDYERLSRNLQKIKNASTEIQDRKQASPTNSVSTRSTVSVENDKIMHYEVTELKAYLVNILHEMEDMKKTISELCVDQDNTKKILKNKNKNIEILTKQIKVLNKNKCRTQKSMTAININQKYSSVDSENKDTYSLDSCEEELFKKHGKNDRISIKNAAIDYYNQLKNQQYIENDVVHQNNKKTEEDDDNDVQTGD